MSRLGRRDDAKAANQNETGDLARAGDEHVLRLDAQGPQPQAAPEALEGERLVNAPSPLTEVYAQVAAMTDGDYVVTWTSFDNGTSEYSAFYRMYNADGTPYTQLTLHGCEDVLTP